MLRKDYTNILKKLVDDLPSYFEDIALRNMTFLALLDISGEWTIMFRVLFHSADRSSKKFSPTGVTKIVNKRNFAMVNNIPCISTTSILGICFRDFSTMTRLNYRSFRSLDVHGTRFLVKIVAEVLNLYIRHNYAKFQLTPLRLFLSQKIWICFKRRVLLTWSSIQKGVSVQSHG